MKPPPNAFHWSNFSDCQYHKYVVGPFCIQCWDEKEKRRKVDEAKNAIDLSTLLISHV